MSILHSPRAPRIMLLLFCIAALTFFMLAAARDMGLISEAVTTGDSVSVTGEIRWQAKQPEETPEPAEGTSIRPHPEVVDGRAAEDRSAEPAAPSIPAGEKPECDTTGSILSHTFSLTDRGFSALFRTDRPAPQARVFFIPAPARWVVDLPGSWINRARYNNRIEDCFISRVVLGEHEKYLRVVFHFRDTEWNGAAKRPVITLDDRGFSIFIAQVEP